ncbi:carbon-nitrogen hydrolase family protein [Aquimonas sp.]|jgi:nitrilase|uniref:carbon-nitrogen hydrolase family protein n=1 Tax=Aquimonas sp. TaxID=1872588 RepID=UPI0037C18D0E
MSQSAAGLTVALAQIAPVWLDRGGTLAKVVARVEEAGLRGARLVAFGEALLPGYPFWLEHTEGARFESPLQKRLYAHYGEQAVQIERGDLAPVCAAARAAEVQVVLGIIERPSERGGHSLYCSLVLIDASGEIRNVHRKLVPTYEERLVWSPGDGHGLRTFDLDGLKLGALNCWENWMPLARSALYAQGLDIHVAAWPGSVRNTEDITRFIAREGRCFVLSVGGLMRRQDVPAHLPESALLRAALPEVMANGGACVAAPDGRWLLPPQPDVEQLFIVELDQCEVAQARQSLDLSGHYSRPDVLTLALNTTRQQVLTRYD